MGCNVTIGFVITRGEGGACINNTCVSFGLALCTALLKAEILRTPRYWWRLGNNLWTEYFLEVCDEMNFSAVLGQAFPDCGGSFTRQPQSRCSPEAHVSIDCRTAVTRQCLGPVEQS